MRPASTSAPCGFRTILAALPLTTKRELVEDQDASPPWGTALTEPIERYTRYCQTSSTTGRPLRWIDTNESWQWVLDCWKAVYRAARVGPAIAFSFRFRSGRSWASGPPSMRRARSARTRARRRDVEPAAIGDDRRRRRHRRVLHADLRAVAGRGRRPKQQQDGAATRSDSSVRVLIVAGEPGGSIPSTRERIEQTLGRPRDRSPRPDRSRSGELRMLGAARRSASSTKRNSSAK